MVTLRASRSARVDLSLLCLIDGVDRIPRGKLGED
jgi:hypothetical protein